MSKDKSDDNRTSKMGRYLVILTALLILWGIGSLMAGGDSDTNRESGDGAAIGAEDSSLSDEVNVVLAAMDNETKRSIAQTSIGGYQGDILNAEPASGAGSVKVNVSTYFEDSGDEENGGRNIARKLFNTICNEVPDLQSLYVVSSSGLESRSVYRSQAPVCN